MVIKNKLDHVMWQKRLTIREVASMTGLSTTTIAQIKADPTISLTSMTLGKLCTGLGIEIHDVIYLADASEDHADDSAKIKLALHAAI